MLVISLFKVEKSLIATLDAVGSGRHIQHPILLLLEPLALVLIGKEAITLVPVGTTGGIVQSSQHISLKDAYIVGRRVRGTGILVGQPIKGGILGRGGIGEGAERSNVVKLDHTVEGGHLLTVLLLGWGKINLGDNGRNVDCLRVINCNGGKILLQSGHCGGRLGLG